MTGLDALGIGNAIVDVIARADDAFLTRHELAKGAMNLIDAARADYLYEQMGPGIEMSGGSAGNTMVGLAMLGGKAGYIGKLRDDVLGRIYRHDITAAGVSFESPLAAAGASTARSLILVTDDAQRTMNTYLGACVELGPDDVDPAFVARAQVLYLEGYLWDPPAAKAAFRKALGVAHEHDRRVALSLSDPFCVARHRAEFRDLVEHHVNVLFANEDEITSLYEVDEFDTALQLARGQCEVVALTRGAKGSVVLGGDEVHLIDAAPVARLVDTTGAGDLYAAGFLYGLTHGMELARCGRLAALAAGEVVSHYGARPESDIAAFVPKSAQPLGA